MYTFSDNIAFGGIKERKRMQQPESWTIINVSQSKIQGYPADKHIPLYDGAHHSSGDQQQEFAEIVNSIRNCIQNEEPVFVHCAVGQSRSVSTLATAIAAEQNKQYKTIETKLTEIRNSYTKPAQSLQVNAKRYLQHMKE